MSRRGRRSSELGLPGDARAEALSPEQFVALAAALEGDAGVILRAPAKLNLCLYLGPRREDGLHELCSLFEPLALADRIEVDAAAERDEVVCPGVEGPNLAAAALDGAARARLGARRRCGSRSRSGSRSPPGSAAAAPTPRRSCGSPAGEVDGLAELAAGLGADVPSQLDPALALVGGAGERIEPLPDPGRARGGPDRRRAAGSRTAEVYAEADRLGLGRGARRELDDARGAGCARRPARGASPLDYRELLVNDLEPAALSLRPEIGEALAALRRGRAPQRDPGQRLRARPRSGSSPTSPRPSRGVGAAAPLRGRDRLGAAAARIIAPDAARGREAQPRSPGS